MVAYGSPGQIVELRGLYECSCRRHEQARLDKGDRFPCHIKSEVWRWGPWPRTAPIVIAELNVTIDVSVTVSTRTASR